MKQKKKFHNKRKLAAKYLPPTVFEQVMNMQCDLRVELNLEPFKHWEKTRETPNWAKNICKNFGNTIFKPLLKLRPRGSVNWHHYGCCVGIGERYLSFISQDVPRILKEEGFDKIDEARWERIKARLGLDQARRYCLKALGRPENDSISDEELFELAILKHFEKIEQMKQTAFRHVAEQSPKIKALFLKGMSDGFIMLLNELGEFTNDRRFNIHTELLAWQFDIEKMQRSVLPKFRPTLFRELSKMPEYKNRTQDWFNDVCKDIKLSIGRRGRPPKYSPA